MIRIRIKLLLKLQFISIAKMFASLNQLKHYQGISSDGMSQNCPPFSIL
jgi:hypothetical protein